jgi:hypothetical protein
METEMMAARDPLGVDFGKLALCFQGKMGSY